MCACVCLCGFFFRVHKFYFTDDNTIIIFFRLVSDGVFPNPLHRIALHVRVIRMSIETTATATLHMQWIWLHLELCECA